MSRIGVFVCHCGLNIAGTVDVKRVAEEIRDYPGVVYSVDYKYMCSDPGQNLVKEAIVEHDLDGVVVAACSPTMHETTFRKAAATAGLNSYLCESANIREQCSWVHQSQPEEATAKAIEIIKTIVEKVRYDESLVPLTLSLVKKALVIGGGVAGLQAALDIAEAGYPVILVEKESHLGGHMRQLSGVYLNFDAAPDLLASTIEAVTQHPNIQVITEAEVEELGGYVGNFTVKVRKSVDSESVDSSESTNVRAYDVGAIVVATGYALYPQEKLGQYGGGQYPDVVDGLQFERMLATGGQIRRPSDGKVPQEVVWVQCAGSRDPAAHALLFQSLLHVRGQTDHHVQAPGA